ncbi:MAG: gliding motility-associated C-terminal domain-containing protein [Cryomorphaceae bacterium]
MKKMGFWLTFLLTFTSQAQPLFIPNQGQWAEDFLAKTALSYGAIFWEKQGYRMTLLNERMMPEHGHGDHTPNLYPEGPDAFAFFCTYAGANPAPTFEGQRPTASPRHYFIGNNPDNWKSDIAEFQGFKITELYPLIDLTWSEKEGELYNAWTIRPGGNPEAITILYDGITPSLDAEGRLVLPTPLGTLVETAPYAYILETGKPVRCDFTLNHGRVGFKVGRYAAGKTLVIDPTLVFSSFSGSLADNWGYTATYDAAGNVYGGGIVFDVGYPTTAGAFDPTYNDPSGGANYLRMDIGLTKFNANGTQRLYSTYIGGSNPDQPHSMMVNNAGDLLIFGTTGSDDFPMPGSGSYDNSYNGGPPYGPSQGSPLNFDFDDGFDAFILKLNPSGTNLLAATYMGTSGNEGLNLALAKNYGDQARGEIVVDAQDNVYVASTSNSGASPLSGTSDAWLFSLTSNLQILRWQTFLGGSGKESGYGIKVVDNGDVYVTGGTTSNDMPLTAGAKFPTAYGGTDGFISRLNPSGVVQRTTYLGTGSTDQSYFIDLDKYGAVYAYGQTMGLWPKTAGTWGTTSGGQFIVKLSSDLSQQIFSTKFGTANNTINLVPTAFNVDDCLNILLSGWGGNVNGGLQGGNTNGLPVTNDAVQSTTDGSDFYFLVLKQNASSALYATFFGGTSSEHVDGGTSRFASDGSIYQAVCAACSNGTFPTTPGVIGPNRMSSNCNLGVIKIDFETSVTAEANIDYDADVDTICDNLRVTFSNNSKNANLYFWDFGNGQTSNAKDPTIIFSKGVWTIKLVAIDTVCDISDSTTLQITHDQGLFPTADFTVDYFACDRNFDVHVVNKSTDSQVHEWRFGNTSLFGDTLTFSYANPGPHSIRLIAYDTTCGTSDTTFQVVQFDQDWSGPEVRVAPDSCKDGRVRVNVTYGVDTVGYIYQWTFHNGVQDTGRVSTYRLPASGTYNVHLDLIDTLCNAVYGYDFTSAVTRMDQRLWIPNAFTPNGDGKNEFLRIAGNDCFPGDHFVILNSYGNVVFETDDPFKTFWDGTIDGKPAQQDTYVYRFETEDGDVFGYVSLLY